MRDDYAGITGFAESIYWNIEQGNRGASVILLNDFFELYMDENLDDDGGDFYGVLNDFIGECSDNWEENDETPDYDMVEFVDILKDTGRSRSGYAHNLSYFEDGQGMDDRQFRSAASIFADMVRSWDRIENNS